MIHTHVRYMLSLNGEVNMPKLGHLILLLIALPYKSATCPKPPSSLQGRNLAFKSPLSRTGSLFHLD